MTNLNFLIGPHLSHLLLCTPNLNFTPQAISSIPGKFKQEFTVHGFLYKHGTYMEYIYKQIKRMYIQQKTCKKVFKYFMNTEIYINGYINTDNFKHGKFC